MTESSPYEWVHTAIDTAGAVSLLVVSAAAWLFRDVLRRVETLERTKHDVEAAMTMRAETNARLDREHGELTARMDRMEENTSRGFDRLADKLDTLRDTIMRGQRP
jgi:HAMP domain-containing protein